jgi:DNA-binding LacI/PurR family transcriptional regulator
VAQDYAAIAEASVEALFGMIEKGGRSAKRTTTLFPGRLVTRLSA